MCTKRRWSRQSTHTTEDHPAVGGNKLLKFFYGMPAFYRMWKVVAYSRYYYSMMKKYGFRNGDNAVLLGHPKFDFTYRALVKREFQNKEWA